MIYTVVVPGELRGKGRPRFSRARGVAYTDAKTLTAENWVKACAVAQLVPVEGLSPAPERGPIELDIETFVPIPKSWSKTKQAEAVAGRLKPTSRPDCDNCLKLICDALNGIAWWDDAQVFKVSMVKRFTAAAPSTVIKILPLPF